MKHNELSKKLNLGAYKKPYHMPSIPDIGHTHICGQCGNRYGNDEGLSGKERELVMKDCETCESLGLGKMAGLYQEARLKSKRKERQRLAVAIKHSYIEV